jgi:putative ATP-binding cassette transporter
LPELKARGKCVVVVTHDDRYFHLGDRVIKLEAASPINALRAGLPERERAHG